MQWKSVQLHAAVCYYIFCWRHHLMWLCAVSNVKTVRRFGVLIGWLKTEMCSGALKLSVSYCKHFLNIPTKYTSLFSIRVSIKSLLHVSVWYIPHVQGEFLITRTIPSAVYCVLCVSHCVCCGVQHIQFVDMQLFLQWLNFVMFVYA